MITDAHLERFRSQTGRPEDLAARVGVDEVYVEGLLEAMLELQARVTALENRGVGDMCASLNANVSQLAARGAFEAKP